MARGACIWTVVVSGGGERGPLCALVNEGRGFAKKGGSGSR